LEQACLTSLAAHPSLFCPQYPHLRLIPLEQFTPELEILPVPTFCCLCEGWDGFELLSESKNLREENFTFEIGNFRLKRQEKERTAKNDPKTSGFRRYREE
jgi:hypothetical protein